MLTEVGAGRTVVLLFSLALLPYANTLADGFTFDDGPVIRKNAEVTDGVDLMRILASPTPPGCIYRPLTMLTFALNERLFPGNPAPFHAVNVILHAATTVLVYLLALRLVASTRVAVIAGALFALHPIHTEAVTNIVGRAEVLAGLFGLLAMLTAMQADAAARSRPRRALQVASLAAFCLALLSKESALTVLPLICLLRVVRRGESLWVGLSQELRGLDWVPYACCAGVFVAVRLYVTQAFTSTPGITPLDNPLVFVPAIVRIRSALGVLWDYFALLNVPLVLAADYSYLQVPIVTSWAEPRFLGGVALVIAPAAALLWQRQLAVRFGVIFPLLALSLTANVLFPIGTVKAERLLYFPSVGWVLVLAYGFDCLLATQRYRGIAVAALATMVLAFGVRTWVRNGDWLDNNTLYRSMVQGAPNSAKARYNFGVALQDQGAHDAAIAQFRRALSIYPWADGAALGIGYSLHKQGFSNDAIQWYQKALAITPGLVEAHTDLCQAHLANGRMAEAAAACRNGLRYDPTDTNLLKGLGLSLVGMSDTAKGIAVLRRSLVLNPGDQWLQSYLARLDPAADGRRGGQVAIR